ncbi:MAG: hypothetical protein P9L92_17210 [Candidatus Electryonea clarkiae]|nr:hypothetical protein [Candidatus Electryonea clarkiae]MDP8288232.1 hypothetical protein [Candidatus Electryonea clarkiae]
MRKGTPAEAAKIAEAKRRKRDIATIIVAILLIPAIIWGVQIIKKEAEIKAVKTQMNSIYTGAKLFTHDRGYQPKGVDQLEDLGLVVMQEKLLGKWTFKMTWPQTIEAAAIENGQESTDKKIVFKIPEELFYGYGCPLHGETW